MELLKYKILLDKYFEGSLSTDEEKMLKYFLQSYNGDDVDLNEAKQIFSVLKKESRQTIDIDFESLINKKSNFKNRLIYGVISGIAASLVIGLSLVFLLKTDNPPVVYAYINGQPITNKKIAIEQSKKALAILSTELNRGTNSLDYMNKMNKPVELLNNITPIEGLLQTK